MISIYVEKVYDRMQFPFMSKTPNKLGLEGNYINIIKSFCACQYKIMFRLINHIKETRLIKNSHKGYLPAKIFLNCLYHMSQWSSLKLIRSRVESFNLFCSFFKQMKSVIPNKVPFPCWVAKWRRFSLTENMSLSSRNSSLHDKSLLESPRKKIKCSNQNHYAHIFYV